MHLGKYHGLGNDFLVAIEAENPGLRADPATAVALCDRRRGIGADGLVYGLSATDDRSDVRMVLLNADGSRAEVSGNGLRCLAQACWRGASEGGAGGRGDRSLLIQTDTAAREARLVDGDPDRRVVASVDMGEPTTGPEPTADTLRWGAANVSTVDVGNPHLVVLVDDPAALDIAVEGPALEQGYERGINVHFVAVMDSTRMTLRVWERGAGVTEACGSGAVAAVVAATDRGLVDPDAGPVEVAMPGGSVTIERTGTSLWLTGPSEFVGEVITP